VDQIEIQDHVPLKHHTPRKSARGARGQGCRSSATQWGSRHPPSSSSVGGSRSLPSSLSRGHHRPTFIICQEVAPRPCSTSLHGAAPSSSSGGIVGTAPSAGGTLGGPPPTSMGGVKRVTSSSVSSCNKAPGARSTKKRCLD
jgi:hypothetical protein